MRIEHTKASSRLRTPGNSQLEKRTGWLVPRKFARSQSVSGATTLLNKATNSRNSHTACRPEMSNPEWISSRTAGDKLMT